MPDWLTHTLVGWIIGKITKIEIGLVVLGSLLPDLTKINIIANWFGLDYQNYFNPLHTPVFAFLIAGIIALFFISSKKAFLALSIGIVTHFILDFFLIGITKGIQFLYPISWEYWRFNYIIFDYPIIIIAIISAFCVYIFYFYTNRKISKKTRD
jgi:hypothetical protein